MVGCRSPSPDNGDLMTLEEVASRIGVEVPVIHRAIAKGDIPAVRTGGDLRVERDALERTLAAPQAEVLKRRNEMRRLATPLIASFIIQAVTCGAAISGDIFSRHNGYVTFLNSSDSDALDIVNTAGIVEVTMDTNTMRGDRIVFMEVATDYPTPEKDSDGLVYRSAYDRHFYNCTKRMNRFTESAGFSGRDLQGKRVWLNANTFPWTTPEWDRNWEIRFKIACDGLR
jgi:excisionase family DNA binding protein